MADRRSYTHSSSTGLWRNGSACDSRSQGWEFESLWPHCGNARMRVTLNEHTLTADAAREDRTHDLRIMRPTRCQLRYRRFQTWCCSLFRLYLRADSCAIMALLTIQAGHRSCGVAWPMVVFVGSRTHDWRVAEATPTHHQRGYGATAARVTPDHKVGSSNLSGLIVAMHASVPR